jgi:Fatty acid hydroxylase superfamily
MHELFWQTIGFLGGVVYSSFFEWNLHKYVMHSPLKFFRYPFLAHAVTHHGKFKADKTYQLQDEADKQTVPMAWWNAPAIWLLHVPPMLAVQWLVGKPIFWGMIGALVLYYVAYEYIHWCMHVPRKRNIERSGIFFRLNGHHLLHHRYMGKNLNVVFPMFDVLFGTLIRRSPVKFAQATGPNVPNVQPKEKKQKSPDEMSLAA